MGFLTVATEAGLVHPGVFTGYLALPGEPDLTDLLVALRDSGATVLLPRVHGVDLQWIPWTMETTFQPGPFGLSEPEGAPIDGASITQCTTLFIPALAVDHVGRRLGQGGGFYDRSLAHIPRHESPGPLRIAVIFDEEFISTVPGEPHDERVDAVLTPTRFIRL